MGFHTRPACPPVVPPLRLGDHVRVVVRTSGGGETWTGHVVATDDRLGLVRISDGARSRTAARRGAAYVVVRAAAADREPVAWPALGLAA